MSNASSRQPSAQAERPGDFCKPVVFYDGACPLCSREIAHYRRLDVHQRLRWVDLTADGETLGRYGLDRIVAARRFHVLDTRGRWQTGAWGFAELWANLPYYRHLAGVLRWSRALPLLDRLYRSVTRWRLRRRCDDTCEVPAARQT